MYDLELHLLNITGQTVHRAACTFSSWVAVFFFPCVMLLMAV